MYGIDVSAAQRPLDWQALKLEGVEFAIIRAGYGITARQKDKRFEDHMNGALQAGIHAGIYWFIYAASEAQARQNAHACAEVIEPYRDKITLPVYCDFEYDSERWAQSVGWSPTMGGREAIITAFIREMRCYGYRVGLYTNVDYITSRIRLNYIHRDSLWLAQYSTSYRSDYKPDVWQYTSTKRYHAYGNNLDGDILINRELISDKIAPTLPEQPEPEPEPSPIRQITYVVKKGDTLSGIAVKYGTTYLRIAKDNNIDNPNLIYPDQKLIING